MLAALQQRGLLLEAILVMHHHADHTGGAPRLREHQHPTRPSTILLERQINPFLRTRQAAVMQAAQAFDASNTDEASTFAALRRWKNEFQ